MHELPAESDPLAQVLADYLQAEDGGNAPDPAMLVAAHPALAAELTEFFENRRTVPRPWTGPLVNEPLPERIGDFEIVALIGHGATGAVYRARQRGLNRLVAVKVLRDGRYATAEGRARFRREAEQLARLDHPHIVRIYQAGEDHGRPYFAMELVEGGSLAERRAAGWLPTPRQAAALVRILAEAVEQVHRQGICHRDLKPANILLESTSLVPKIVDFGLAKAATDAALTATHAIIGTASYMAPEQAAGAAAAGRADGRADIYALGAILYELLTGRPPFVGPTIDEILGQVRQDEPLPPRQLAPGVDRDLETVCLQCLRKRPEDRYASAAAVAVELDRYLKGLPVQARPRTRVQRIAAAVANPGLMRTYHAYGAMYLLAGVAFAAAHAGVFFVFRVHGPEVLVWLALVAPYALPLMLVRRPRYPWTGLASWLDRQLRTLWVGHILAVTTVFLALRLRCPDMAATAEFGYPAVATLVGFAFFLLGTDYWGRYYAFGLIWLVAAPVMAVSPTWAPLEFSILILACFAQIALSMRRMARQHAAAPGPAEHEKNSACGA